MSEIATKEDLKKLEEKLFKSLEQKQDEPDKDEDKKPDEEEEKQESEEDKKPEEETEEKQEDLEARISALETKLSEILEAIKPKEEVEETAKEGGEAGTGEPEPEKLPKATAEEVQEKPAPEEAEEDKVKITEKLLKELKKDVSSIKKSFSEIKKTTTPRPETRDYEPATLTKDQYQDPNLALKIAKGEIRPTAQDLVNMERDMINKQLEKVFGGR